MNLADDKTTIGQTVLRPQFVPKGWGYELIAVNNENYAGKLLHFVSGRKCSIHYHKKKHETFFLQRGRMEIYSYDNAKELKKLSEKHSPYDIMERYELTQGQVFSVPVGRVHQMIALEDSDLFEFSTSDEESDSYRLVKGD